MGSFFGDGDLDDLYAIAKWVEGRVEEEAEKKRYRSMLGSDSALDSHERVYRSVYV